MTANALPMPSWAAPSVRPELRKALGRAATKAWAQAALHFTQESASALSKRLSAPEAKPGTNSKYLYQLAGGRHTVYPKSRGLQDYNWIAAVDRYADPLDPRRAGHLATPFYYQPWELMVPVVSLDRVCELLYTALDSFRDTYEFFFDVTKGLPETEGWRRKPSKIWVEVEVLEDVADDPADDASKRDKRVFDRFTALWCLYREAILRRNLVKGIYYREAIIRSHREIARHPVFSLVFDEYRQCAMNVLEADGLPARKDIRRENVQRLESGNDADRDHRDLLMVIPYENKLAYDLLRHSRRPKPKVTRRGRKKGAAFVKRSFPR